MADVLHDKGIDTNKLTVELVNACKQTPAGAAQVLSYLYTKPDPKIPDGTVELPQILRTIKEVEAEGEGMEVVNKGEGDE